VRPSTTTATALKSSLHTPRPQCGPGILLVILLGALFGCASVPGETLAPRGLRRDVSARVLAQAGQANPGCRSPRIADTEVLELHGGGTVALERWVVEQCGTRANYLVTFPSGTKAPTVVVKPE
jgi:hypothetical protein